MKLWCYQLIYYRTKATFLCVFSVECSLLGSYFIISGRPLANERAWHARYSGYRGQWGHGRCHTHHWSRGDTGQHSGIPPPPTLSRTKYSANSSYPASCGAPKIQFIHLFLQIHLLKYPDTWSIGINPSLNGSLKTDLGIKLYLNLVHHWHWINGLHAHGLDGSSELFWHFWTSSK